MRAQALISKHRVQKTDRDSNSSSSSSSTELADDEQEPVDTEGNVKQTDKKSSSNSMPKGSFVTTHHGLPPKAKCVCKFKCKVCDGIFNSTKKWNRHYKTTHPTNPTSLYRHRYTDTKTENLYPCLQCMSVFPFSSQLSSHMFKHRKVNHFLCSFTGCSKAFKTKWNRQAHEKSHQNAEIKCKHCDYKTKDIWYFKQHVRVHLDTLKYKCNKCGKGFRFYEQKKRHDQKGCI